MPHIEHTFALAFEFAFAYHFCLLHWALCAAKTPISHFIAPREFLGGIFWAHKMPQFIEQSDNSTIIFIFFWYKTVEIDFRCDFETWKK